MLDASELQWAVRQADRLREAIAARVFGQSHVVEQMLIALVAGGHILLEGPPGIAKTLLAKTFAACLAGEFRRVSCTPDLLTSDLVGVEVYHPQSGRFRLRRGPIFTNVLLVDELNRAPAKLQSGLLEAMQERQVTIGRRHLPLPEFFWVIATQNPREYEGTFPLAEAQLDRFLLQAEMKPPDAEQEMRVAAAENRVVQPPAEPVWSPSEVARFATFVDRIYLEPRVLRYAVDLCRATRGDLASNLAPKLTSTVAAIAHGASPRATQGLVRVARAVALLAGRDFVLPVDIANWIKPVLRHRISLTFVAANSGLTSDQLLAEILAAMPVP